MIFLTILFCILGFIVFHTVVGMFLLKFFVKYRTKDHAKGLCLSSSCRPRARKRGYEADVYLGYNNAYEKAFDDDYKTIERRDACIVARAKEDAFWWIPALFSIVPQIMATNHLSTAKADAERLAVLEAERAAREARVAVILEELQISDDAKIKKAFALAGIE